MAADDPPRRLVFEALDERVLRFRPGGKWSSVAPDVLPASVADLDFPVAAPIDAALRRYLDLGDYGYPDWPDGASPLRTAYAHRMKRRYGWWPDPEHVREFTDCTQAVRCAIEQCTEPGDGVALHTPAFGPFTDMITRLGRRVVSLPLLDRPHGWTFDADDVARRVALGRCRVLLLVNPHNPTGRVFSRAELTALAELAERHDLVVISDDLHADITYPPHRHTPFASLDPAVEARTVTVYAASKAFGLAGLRTAVGHVSAARAVCF